MTASAGTASATVPNVKSLRSGGVHIMECAHMGKIECAHVKKIHNNEIVTVLAENHPTVAVNQERDRERDTASMTRLALPISAYAMRLPSFVDRGACAGYHPSTSSPRTGQSGSSRGSEHSNALAVTPTRVPIQDR
jgi:hypothetical protein